MMLDLELRAKLSDYCIDKVGTIVRDDPFKDAIPTVNVILNESDHNIFGTFDHDK